MSVVDHWLYSTIKGSSTVKVLRYLLFSNKQGTAEQRNYLNCELPMYPLSKKSDQIFDWNDFICIWNVHVKLTMVAKIPNL
jgi:hypothetical protein